MRYQVQHAISPLHLRSYTWSEQEAREEIMRRMKHMLTEKFMEISFESGQPYVFRLGPFERLNNPADLAPVIYYRMSMDIEPVQNMTVLMYTAADSPFVPMVKTHGAYVIEHICEYCGNAYDPKQHRFCPDCGGRRPTIQAIERREREQNRL